MSERLYVVGTPIGNLNDITTRALKTLNEVDLIAAEDTRVTLALLNRFKIHKKVISYREQNHKSASHVILKTLKNNLSVALVSDAGMPCISDPGFMLVKEAVNNGIEVVSVPGPSAFTSAISISGLNCENFIFLGFLPSKTNERIIKIAELKNVNIPIVVYEAPHKLKQTLIDFNAVLGDRVLFIAGELTKKHESGRLTTLSRAVDFYSNNDPKGEYVLIVEGGKKVSRSTLKEAADFGMKLNKMGVKLSKAAKLSADIFDFNKSEIYPELLKLKGEI